jgi:O-antigen/teichoic acid export membrane protein
VSQATDKANYKLIFKSTSLFGGVQIVQIIATLIRAKFVAVFLGSIGMGISGLLISSTTFIQTIAGFGLNTSGVREISKANETEDYSRFSRTVIVFYRWLFCSAIFGILLIIVFAPWLSKFIFGNDEYIFAFVCLSVMVAVNILGNGYATVLQGTRRLKDLAKSNVLGAALSVVIIIPIYYFFRIKGIVPALILSSVATFFIYFTFAKKIKPDRIKIEVKETIIEGGEMAKLGVIIMLTSFMGTLTILLINTFIKRTGSLSDVGLYQAGMNMTNQSIGLVFTAMGVDYFPRLSAVSADSHKVRSIANQQAEMMLLIITPILLLLILTTPLLIRILLSTDFFPITNFIRLIALGMFFQAANYAMGLISFAKGDKKTFLMLGIAGNLLWLLFSVIGYLFNGLMGISIFFVVHSIICFFIVYITAYKKYQYLMSSSFIRLMLFGLLLVVSMCVMVILLPNIIGYSVSVVILFCAIGFSIFKLNELIGLKEIIRGIFSKLKINNSRS